MVEWQTICFDAIQKLCDQAKLNGTNLNMKVKWNACYAIGNFMKNSAIFNLQTNQFSWQVRIGIAICFIDKNKVFYSRLSLNFVELFVVVVFVGIGFQNIVKYHCEMCEF